MTALLDAICDEDNLWEAWRQVARKKSAPGVDGRSVPDFATAPEKHLCQLQQQLRRGTYEPLPLRGVWIPKRDGGWRKAGVPSVRDRVAQRAWLEVLVPIIDARFADTSHAYRPARSIRTAIAQVESLRDSGRRVVLKADVADCFDSIDRELLLATLAHHVGETAPVELARHWMEAGTIWHQHDALPLLGEQGLAQGDLVSPLLCNLFLDAFDSVLWDGGFRPVRYADDFVIPVRREGGAQAALDLVRRTLADLGLQLNLGKTGITSFAQGFKYLGALFVGSCVLPLHRHETLNHRGRPVVRFTTGYEAKPPRPFTPGPASHRPAPPRPSAADAVATALRHSPAASHQAPFAAALQERHTARREQLARDATVPCATAFLV